MLHRHRMLVRLGERGEGTTMGHCRGFERLCDGSWNEGLSVNVVWQQPSLRELADQLKYLSEQ